MTAAPITSRAEAIHRERYPSYRASDVDWIEALPRHWGSKPLKYLVELNPESLREDTNPDHEIRYVDIGSVGQGQLLTEPEILSFRDAPSRARRVVRANDVIISTVRTYLKAVAQFPDPPGNLIVSTGFAVLRPLPTVDRTFLFYAVSSQGFVDAVVAHSVGVSYPAINASDLVRLSVPVPPLPEQRTIVAYLECEIAQIDELVEKKRRLIGLLEEKRAAVIARAMVDGGTCWQENTDDDDKMSRLKMMTTMVTSGSRGWASHYSDKGSIFLRIGNLTRTSIGLDLGQIQYVNPPEGAEGERTRVCKGDILVSITAYIGSVAVVEQDLAKAYVNQHIALVRPRSELVLSRWLAYYLLSPSGQQQFQMQLYGGTKDGLGLEEVRNLRVPMLPLNHQIAVTAYINRESAKLGLLIAKLRESIEQLTERRTALITAAVTGQIDVRDELEVSI
jgi:type I restriction enzyme S subunit